MGQNMITISSLAHTMSVNSAFYGMPALRAIEVSRPAKPRRRRFFRRAEPTTFQRCLAVHLHFASKVGALE
jgi:hypothetical protein